MQLSSCFQTSSSPTRSPAISNRNRNPNYPSKKLLTAFLTSKLPLTQFLVPQLVQIFWVSVMKPLWSLLSFSTQALSKRCYRRWHQSSYHRLTRRVGSKDGKERAGKRYWLILSSPRWLKIWANMLTTGSPRKGTARQSAPKRWINSTRYSLNDRRCSSHQTIFYCKELILHFYADGWKKSLVSY